MKHSNRISNPSDALAHQDIKFLSMSHANLITILWDCEGNHHFAPTMKTMRILKKGGIIALQDSCAEADAVFQLQSMGLPHDNLVINGMVDDDEIDDKWRDVVRLQELNEDEDDSDYDIQLN